MHLFDRPLQIFVPELERSKNFRLQSTSLLTFCECEPYRQCCAMIHLCLLEAFAAQILNEMSHIKEQFIIKEAVEAFPKAVTAGRNAKRKPAWGAPKDLPAVQSPSPHIVQKVSEY